MPPYPPKPLAGYVLGKGYEKIWKERKEAPRQESLFGAKSGIAASLGMFLLSCLVVPPGWWPRFSTVPAIHTRF
jgi:hypothetical protein